MTRSELKLEIMSVDSKKYNDKEEEIIYNAVLFGEDGWFYPVINGIPRLLIESFLDYECFLRNHLKDYELRKQHLLQTNAHLLKSAVKKNKKSKDSFAQEWDLHNPVKDKTWDEDPAGMLRRFFAEINEAEQDIAGKYIFDAGSGNGLLDTLIANKGAFVLAMDFSKSVEKSFVNNTNPNAFFIQGDVQFPPVAFGVFDILHSSGVLHHTNNTELSFCNLAPCIKANGKFSMWLYHPRKNTVHNLFNLFRKFFSKLPLRFQYYFYSLTLLPGSFVVKKLKGSKQNATEMMVDILDWFTPEYRWEHTQQEVICWFKKQNFLSTKITTSSTFGFNTTGVKS